MSNAILFQMRAPQPIILKHDQLVVSRDNMLFCLCRVCANEVNWAHKDSTYLLYSTCCCFVYWAYPVGENMKAYIVQVKPAPMQNVYWLYRKSPLEPGDPAS